MLQAEIHRVRLVSIESDPFGLWEHGGGFSVDAEVRIEAHERDGLERLLRYCARPAFALERLREMGKRGREKGKRGQSPFFSFSIDVPAPVLLTRTGYPPRQSPQSAVPASAPKHPPDPAVPKLPIVTDAAY